LLGTLHSKEKEQYPQNCLPKGLIFFLKLSSKKLKWIQKSTSPLIQLHQKLQNLFLIGFKDDKPPHLLKPAAVEKEFFHIIIFPTN